MMSPGVFPVRLFLLSAFLMSSCAGIATAFAVREAVRQTSDFAWQRGDHTVALSRDGRVVWQFHRIQLLSHQFLYK